MRISDWSSDVCSSDLPQSAKRLSLRLDLRVAGVLDRIEALLAQHRPGGTPLRYDLLLPDGAAGTLDLNGGHSVRAAADLIGTLRAQPGVRAVKLAMRSDERRVGKECVSTCGYRWSPYP